MKNKFLNIAALTLITYSINAQIGGLIGKIGGKSNKDESVKFSALILKNYISHFKTFTKSDFIDNEIAKAREKSALLFSGDSAKHMYEYVQKNIKKYTENASIAEEYASLFSNFNTQFESDVIVKINEKIKTPYGDKYEISVSEINWLKNAAKAILTVKNIYTGKYDLNELDNSLKTKKNEYATSLIKTKSLSCIDQLDYYAQIRFSGSADEKECIKGTDNYYADATNTGIYLYYTGEIRLSDYEIYIDGKPTKASLSESDLEDSNNGNKKPVNGWYRIQLLPGLKESNHRTISRLLYLSKNGLTKSCEIELKNDRIGSSYKFKYNISSFVKDINSYNEEVKKNYLTTIKLTDTKYSNAVVEKEVIEAYKKHNTINPQYNIGEVKKVNVAGNDWTVYKTKLGLPDYQQTDAYFLVKGKDGNCYSDRRKIRRVYDPATKKYSPIKVVGDDSKMEISCDLVN